LPFAALVIGRTVPDLCLLLPFRVDGLYRHAHSLHGPVTVNLAAGWAAYLLWRLLLDRPLRDLLPAPWHRRVALPATMRVTAAGAGAVSAGIAIDTSLAWRLHHLATRGSSATTAGGLVYAACRQLARYRTASGVVPRQPTHGGPA